MSFLYHLKSLFSGIRIRLNFSISFSVQEIKLKNKFRFFNSACIFLDVFWPKILPEYMNSCRKAYNEDKLVLQKAEMMHYPATKI